MIDNEDWVKSRKWDLYCVGTLVTTVPGLLWAINATDLATPAQIAAVEKFTQLPAWTPAPAVLKDAVNNFVRSRGAIRQSTMEWRGSFDESKVERVPAGSSDGGQFTSGDGGGGTESKSALGAAPTAFIQKQVNEFYKAGGTIKFGSANPATISMLNAAIANFKDVRTSMIEAQGGDTHLDRNTRLGISYTGMALNSYNSGVAIAYDTNGDVAGAMSFVLGDEKTPLHVGYLGSMGTMPGTGTALQVAVAGIAEQTGSSLTSTAVNTAISYHEAIGRTLTGGTGDGTSDDMPNSSWTSFQVKVVAAIRPRLTS